MSWEELQQKLNKRPPDQILLIEDGIKWLPIEYVLDKLNEIFGFDNWRLSEIRLMNVNANNEEYLGRSCSLQFEYKHPDSGQWVRKAGVSGQKYPNDQRLVERALLNAVMPLGDTFGRHLSSQFE